MAAGSILHSIVKGSEVTSCMYALPPLTWGEHFVVSCSTTLRSYMAHSC